MTDAFADKWNKQYEHLKEYKRKNGNCLVPQKYLTDSLGAWVKRVRETHIKNKLPSDRKDLLDEIGFVWNVANSASACEDLERKWKKQYEKLIEFKRKNGHCLVPCRYQQDKSLGIWVANQRWEFHGNCKNKQLKKGRKELLDELGFVWRVHKCAPWKMHYAKLVKFKRKHGHCVVPNRYPPDLSLGKWVGTQRSYYHNHTIPQARKNLLNNLGFVWKCDTVAYRSSAAAMDYVSCRSWMVSFRTLDSGPFSHSRCVSAFINLCS
jgi:hypothetical protein